MSVEEDRSSVQSLPSGGTSSHPPSSHPPSSHPPSSHFPGDPSKQLPDVVEEAEEATGSTEMIGASPGGGDSDPGGTETAGIDPGDREPEEEEVYTDEDEGLSAEELILLHSRQGNVKKVINLLERQSTGDTAAPPDVNCKGRQRSNAGWSPIHLAAYFGHSDVVSALLEHGANINAENDVGDTALHRAAYTGRENVVTLLLKKNADVNVTNIEGNTAKMVARGSHLRSLIEAAEATEQKRSKEVFLRAATNGDTNTLTEMLKLHSQMNINGTDQFGNTALHLAAIRGRKEAAVLLLQNGIDTTLKNAKGQTALDVCSDPQMQQLLDVTPIRELRKVPSRFEGQLAKKTRILGWRPFWVVLERGVLNLYKTRLDGATGAKRKACKHLERATFETKSGTGHIFFVRFSDNSIMYLAVTPDEEANINRQRWENALREHIAYSTSLHQETGVSDDEDFEDLMPLGSITDALQTAGAHQQVLEKQVAALSTMVQNMSDKSSKVQILSIRQHMGHVVETSREMFTSLSHCATVFTQQEQESCKMSCTLSYKYKERRMKHELTTTVPSASSGGQGKKRKPLDECLPVHRIAAKAQIKELQDNEEYEGKNKDKIVLVSLASNVMSRYTSFIGVDRGRVEKVKGHMERRVVPLGKEKEGQASTSQAPHAVPIARPAPAPAPAPRNYGGGPSDCTLAQHYQENKDISEIPAIKDSTSGNELDLIVPSKKRKVEKDIENKEIPTAKCVFAKWYDGNYYPGKLGQGADKSLMVEFADSLVLSAQKRSDLIAAGQLRAADELVVMVPGCHGYQWAMLLEYCGDKDLFTVALHDGTVLS